MTVSVAFLPGARSRLLPASVPFSFFAAAVVFHLALWAAIGLAAADVPSFVGGLGWPLAALHLLVLGVLAATAMGAAFQLLPVATRRPLATVWPARASFFLFVPGVAILAYGMAARAIEALGLGVGLAAIALLLFAGVIADNLRRAGDLPAVAAHGWIAVVSLVALVALGIALALDLPLGFLADHAGVALAHFIVAAFGFMGMLALGFSQVLVPMFVLSEPPGRRPAMACAALSAVAVALGTAGALAAVPVALVTALILGLAAAALHLAAMRQVMASRMRRRLGVSFVLVRVSWGLLLAGPAIGLLALFEVIGERGPTLFGFIVVFGWLLTFLLGVLQRIMPFLAAMHAAKGRRKPPLVSNLTAVVPLRVHAVCHFAALLLVGAAIAVDSVPLVRLGAGFGLVGALAFAAFALGVFRHLAPAEKADG